MTEKFSNALMAWIQAQDTVREWLRSNPGQHLPVVLHANLQRAEAAYQASIQEGVKDAKLTRSA